MQYVFLIKISYKSQVQLYSTHLNFKPENNCLTIKQNKQELTSQLMTGIEPNDLFHL